MMRHVVETKGKENYIRIFFLFKSAVLVDFIRDGDLEMETEKVLVCLLLHSGRAGRTWRVWGALQSLWLCSFMPRHWLLPIKGGITTSDPDCSHFQTATKCQHRLSITCSPFSHRHSLEARPAPEHRCRQALFWQHWLRLWLGVRIA